MSVATSTPVSSIQSRPGDAEVEQAVGDVVRDLLRAENRDVDHARIVDVRAVVDVGRTHDREVGVFEQLQGRLLERSLGQHQAQHRLVRVAVAGSCPRDNQAVADSRAR